MPPSPSSCRPKNGDLFCANELQDWGVPSPLSSQFGSVDGGGKSGAAFSGNELEDWGLQSPLRKHFNSVDGGLKPGAIFSGNEVEEQVLGSPYSRRWNHQSMGGGSAVGSPTFHETVLALQKFLPSNVGEEEEEEEAWRATADMYSSDEFRMFEFKVRRCMRGRSHDWTECPFAHPGEKARRRDPRKFLYSGAACPEFRKGNCKRGDSCELAHGVFESWLHPSRYRTQACKDGRDCKRRVCFFAHSREQLRVSANCLSPPVSPSMNSPESRENWPSPFANRMPCFAQNGSSLSVQESFHSQPGIVQESFHSQAGIPAHRRHLERLNSSPSLTIPPSEPRRSYSTFPSPTSLYGQPSNQMLELVALLKQVEIDGSEPCWIQPQTPIMQPRFSPSPSPLRHSPLNLPEKMDCKGPSAVDLWNLNEREASEPSLERVESGRGLRAKIFENLMKGNHQQGSDEEEDPDVNWVDELV